MADGTLGGTVLNIRTNQPVENATIEAKGDGTDQKTTSGPDGSFSMDLPTGTYDVMVTAAGFDPGDYPGVFVMENNPTVLNLALWPTDV